MVAGDTTVILGRIVGVHGVRGMVKIHSECRPREAIFRYRHFLVAPPKGGTPQTLTLQNGRPQGQGLVASFREITDRDQAHSMINYLLSVQRSALPPLASGEYYWADLIGLQVVNKEGVSFGRVAEIFETGANDVLVVRKNRQEVLIPLVMQHYIVSIDLSAQCITVDWDSAWLDE